LNKTALFSAQIITRRVAKVIDCRPIAGPSTAIDKTSSLRPLRLCGEKVSIIFKSDLIGLVRFYHVGLYG
jgi:hypothetical protein